MDGIALEWATAFAACHWVGHRLPSERTALYRYRAVAYLCLQSGALARTSWLCHHALDAQVACRRPSRSWYGRCISVVYQQLQIITVRLGGGLYLGPRHLIPLLPFLALPVFFGARKLRVLFYPLAAISAFYMLLGTAVEPRVAFPFGDINHDFLLPDYLTGHFAQNTTSLFDRAHRNLTSDSTAANLAKLTHVPGPYQLGPLMGWWAIIGATLQQTRKRLWSIGTVVLFLFVGAIAAAPVIHHAMIAPRANMHGLLGKYYRNATWAGAPADVKIDPAIDFDWPKTTPHPAPLSVEWTSEIFIEREGFYLFTLAADDGALLEIDRKLIVDASHSAGAEKSQTTVLARGRHSIRVRYFNLLFGGSVKLWWTLIGRPRQIVPNEVLLPELAGLPSK
jgi:PA14 domain